jgi:hypothetical protein
LGCQQNRVQENRKCGSALCLDRFDFSGGSDCLFGDGRFVPLDVQKAQVTGTERCFEILVSTKHKQQAKGQICQT